MGFVSGSVLVVKPWLEAEDGCNQESAVQSLLSSNNADGALHGSHSVHRAILRGSYLSSRCTQCGTINVHYINVVGPIGIGETDSSSSRPPLASELYFQISCHLGTECGFLQVGAIQEECIRHMGKNSTDFEDSSQRNM